MSYGKQTEKVQQPSDPMHEISLSYAENYMHWKKHLADFCEKTSRILENDALRYSLKSRIKSFESLSEKLSFLVAQQPAKEPQIKDLLGVRVVVPFQEGVEKVVSTLRRHFEIKEIERKSEQLSYREFAYDAVHMEIPVDRHLGLPHCCKLVIEVQVRTILQDAWAEVEHELIYKNHFRFPNNESIRKKLACLKANLTLSDMIFQEIRDSQAEMEKWGRARFRALIDKAVDFEGPSLPPTLKIAEHRVESLEQEAPGAPATNRAELEKYLLAALKAHNEQDYKTAIQYYSMVLERNPELSIRSMVFSHRGMAHFMLQQESQALSDFDRSFYCDKSNYRSLNYRAMVLRRMGYVEQALECFATSLEIQANQAEVYFLRAQTLAEIHRETEALTDAIKALELDPGHAEALNLMEKLSNEVEASHKPL